MKKVSTLVMTLFLVAVCFCQAQAVDVLISPDTLVIDEDDTEFYLTVHAEIRYSLVVGGSVKLAGIEADYTTSDSRGDLVAGFTVVKTEVDWLIPGESVELTLTGNLVAGGTFSGSDVIWIINKQDGGPGDDDEPGSDKTGNQEGNREGAED